MNTDTNTITNIDYCSDFFCTYHLHDDEEEQDDLYRIQYLQAFQLKHWDDDIISHKMDLLYNKLQIEKEFISLIDLIPQTNNTIFYLYQIQNNSSLEKRILFNFLFQFDFFYLTHNCICQFLNENKIKRETLSELKNAIIEKSKYNKI